ncbi:hypothetical protein SS50377_20596 [Spironucleus salmonicida]|uniref:Uncharacterized protein n=1 Tax=Spironucleus salmonicida TaxID=348837 RepID=V6LQ79_9EUKA|nr:hypothetical protein SS50377_28780 [Spironucleus salmonicida]KAH0577245.1 hypothetical protein SS50377_20596 [Spironucleus salmonicida]|eukprot:EST45866.1 Hypothetical protein SS50377_14152 [Spironucleus salmonicida]
MAQMSDQEISQDNFMQSIFQPINTYCSINAQNLATESVIFSFPVSGLHSNNNSDNYTYQVEQKTQPLLLNKSVSTVGEVEDSIDVCSMIGSIDQTLSGDQNEQ